MWLSDSGSGFGKIVKCQTDLQKKCQMELHNDSENSGKPYKSRLPVLCACKMLAVYFDSVGLILSPLKSNGKESKKSISSTSFALLCVSIFRSDGI